MVLLGQAKEAEHGEKRDTILQMWDGVVVESIGADMKAHVEMARSLFLSKLPLATRVACPGKRRSHFVRSGLEG